MNHRLIAKALLTALPLALFSTMASAQQAQSPVQNTLPSSSELANALKNIPTGGSSYKYNAGTGAQFNATPSALSAGWYSEHCWTLQNIWNGSSTITIAYTIEGHSWIWSVNSIFANSMESVMIDVCRSGAYAFFHVFNSNGNWDEIQTK
jgi:hypothetical protein